MYSRRYHRYYEGPNVYNFLLDSRTLSSDQRSKLFHNLNYLEMGTEFQVGSGSNPHTMTMVSPTGLTRPTTTLSGIVSLIARHPDSITVGFSGGFVLTIML